MVSPALASSARRAAMLTPSPRTLNVSTMTSATWMPTRRASGGAPTSALECARSWCSWKAQRTAREARKFARHLLARRAHAAGDLVMCWCALDASDVGGNTACPCQAHELGPHPPGHALRAELEKPVGQLAYRAGEPAQQPFPHRRVIGEDRAECLGRHRGEERLAHCYHVGKARASVDRRMLAEHVARGHVAQDDLAAA